MFESWKCEFGDVKNPFAHLRCMKNLIALFICNYLVLITSNYLCYLYVVVKPIGLCLIAHFLYVVNFLNIVNRQFYLKKKYFFLHCQKSCFVAFIHE